MIKRIRQYYLEKRRQRALRNIRAFFAMFGHDTSDLTDEEIEQGCERISSVVKRAGFTADEFRAAFEKLGKVGIEIR